MMYCYIHFLLVDFYRLTDNKHRSHILVYLSFQLTFYIDRTMVRQVTLDFDIQFVVTGGNVYLGGSPDTSGLTDGVISVGYNGALTEV